MQPKAPVPVTQSRAAVPVRRSFSGALKAAAISSDDITFNVTGVTTVSVSGSPVLADGVTPSTAVLSLENYVSSDETVFTVSPDPANPLGAIINFVGDGTATLTETATATEADGVTTEQIQGVVTITLTSTSSGVAASIVFSFGVPE